jgi:hypothetical protein
LIIHILIILYLVKQIGFFHCSIIRLTQLHSNHFLEFTRLLLKSSKFYIGYGGNGVEFHTSPVGIHRFNY